MFPEEKSIALLVQIEPLHLFQIFQKDRGHADFEDRRPLPAVNQQ
jgi:hypothetical protein